MPTLRSLALPASLAAALLLTGCEPGANAPADGKLVKQTGEPEGGSCCDEPTPTLAQMRAEAAKKAAEKNDAAAETPSKVSAKPQAAAVVREPKDRDKLALLAEENGEFTSAFHFTDQDGQPFDSKSFLGKPAVATFIFTRCKNLQMCPLQTLKMATLQKALEKEGLADKVNLLIFTFDPDYDTPERLKKFGADQGVKFTPTAKMLRPSPRELFDFKYEFQFTAFPTPDGELNHKTDLLLIDHEGRVAAFYAGMQAWDDAAVKEEVVKLVGEMK